jgi:hypothetical protein
MSKDLYIKRPKIQRDKRKLYAKKDGTGLEHRLPTAKEKATEAGIFILKCIFTPLYYGWKFIKWAFNTIFFETRKTGDNGIFGPGYRSYYRTDFSWGRLSFVSLIIFVILYLIFK